MNPLIDWLGSGGLPVSREQAERRSNACLTGNNGEPCPHHVAPKWWETAKGPVAAAIKQQLAAKHAISLTLSHESDMRMCSQCGCCMALKCWTPIDHIKTYTPISEVGKYPNFCWIRKELTT